VNTLRPLIIPVFFGSAFNIFLLRQFMMTIPHEMDDAARMDGASWFGIYSRILLPLSAPALGVVAIGEFTFRWNDFLGPLIYLNTPDKFTIQLGLRMLTTQYQSDVPGTMAMTVVSLVPVLLVFFLAQRYFIQGIVISGIKG
jgi:ABC-type glycerol-3-phosphate transport system permease component